MADVPCDSLPAAGLAAAGILWLGYVRPLRSDFTITPGPMRAARRPMVMTTSAVTGATGYIGAAGPAACWRRAIPCACWCTIPPGWAAAWVDQVEVCTGDVLEAANAARRAGGTWR